MASPGPDDPPGPRDPPGTGLFAWRVAAEVDGYRLLEPLGAGGMGRVFLAEHVATGARRAIKVLTEVTTPELVARFQRRTPRRRRSGTLTCASSSSRPG